MTARPPRSRRDTPPRRAASATGPRPGTGPGDDDRPAAPRRLRADAARNRARVLDAARHAFAAGDEPVVLDAVARAAGVGIGTLYRHFPTRDALAEAVYAAELDALAAAATQLADGRRADAALRDWMARFADYIATKRGMADALRASGAFERSDARARLSVAADALLRAGAADGTLRGDVRGTDVVASLVGIVLAVPDDPRGPQAGRMMDLLLDGVRRRAE